MAATVTITDRGKNFASEFGTAEIDFIVPKQSGAWNRYREDARRLLDLMSGKEVTLEGEYPINANAIGVSCLMGAMAQLIDEGYYGKDNE